MRELQWAMERSLMRTFDSYMWRYRDPSRTTTVIDPLGRLKFSDRVLVRVRPDKPLTEPLYLREASYNSYSFGVWSAPGQQFTALDPDLSDHYLAAKSNIFRLS